MGRRLRGQWIVLASVSGALAACGGGDHSPAPTGGASAGTNQDASGGGTGAVQTVAGHSAAAGVLSSAGTSATSDAAVPAVQDASLGPRPDGGATDGSSPTAPDGALAGSDAGRDAADPEPIDCPMQALGAGDRGASLMHDGLRREFLIHIPPSYDNTRPVPLVLNFHGATSNAEQQRSLFSRMDATADAEGFIVVYPEGIGASWNAGACCREAASQDVDDVGFARAIVAYMAQQTCIDLKRVYATGFSNGGRLSYRLGCEAADLFAAIAPVAGTKSFPDLENSPGCVPARPLSLIDFMGTADSRIQAQSGQVQEWVAFNGCRDAEPSEVYRRGAHFCNAYTECEAGTSVTYCVVDGGGHCWPGSTPCVLGSTSSADELSANDLMWELFERSTL